jgi:hypothetical protein
MENYPSNSNASKQKKLEQSNKRGVTIKKKSEVRKFADAFLAEDLSNEKRNKQLKQSLNELHKGCNNGLPPVTLCVLP